MRVIFGIAPASDSIYIDGKAAAWCASSASGQKIRRLCGDREYRFANAGDSFPGQRPGDRGDKTPSLTVGYERLKAVIADEFNGDPVQVLLLGITYWRRVLGLKRSLNHLTEDIGPVPVAASIPFLIGGAAAALLYLFPHPRNWAHPNRRDGPAYRLFLAQNLAAQPIKRRSGSADRLSEADYSSVLADFELGLEMGSSTSPTFDPC